MPDHFGMPGVGGSLGKCAVCGDTFLLAILTGNKVVPFQVGGIKQTLYAHPPCYEKVEKITDPKDLPDGPLKDAFTEQPDTVNTP
jgi:hypothetical protein